MTPKEVFLQRCSNFVNAPEEVVNLISNALGHTLGNAEKWYSVELGLQACAGGRISLASLTETWLCYDITRNFAVQIKTRILDT